MKWIALTIASGLAALAIGLEVSGDDATRQIPDASVVQTSTTYLIEPARKRRQLDGSDLKSSASR